MYCWSTGGTVAERKVMITSGLRPGLTAALSMTIRLPYCGGTNVLRSEVKVKEEVKV